MSKTPIGVVRNAGWKPLLAETHLATLHQAVRDTFSPAVASKTLAEAGRRAALEFLRPISAPALEQRRALPRHVAIALLLDSLRRWAPFFGAEGRFTATGGQRPVLIIIGNPLCDGVPRGMRVCAWHEALFETLFQALVASDARVQETSCLALGDADCRFEVTLGGS